MRRLLWIIPLVACGCFENPQLVEASRQDLILSTMYVNQMNAGKTTPEQDKKFIIATQQAYYTIYATQVGTATADAVKASAGK